MFFGKNDPPIKPEYSLARKKLNKFFQEEIDQSTTIHFETDKMKGMYTHLNEDDFRDCTIYESDYLLKRKIGLPQLTAARMVCSHHAKKVFFGKPDSLLLIEEMCSRLSLKELQEIFESTIQEYNDTQNEMGSSCIPAYNTIDVHSSLRDITTRKSA